MEARGYGDVVPLNPQVRVGNRGPAGVRTRDIREVRHPDGDPRDKADPDADEWAPRTAVPRALLGEHESIVRVHRLIDRVADGPQLVLVRGESGTGKELVADAIHARSARAGAPLIKVNCGALTDSLLHSELFGHERGAFTGAVERTRGCFEAAHRGTLFLDEVGDVSPRAQVALLRVLEERRVSRVGGSAPVPVDVRVICATHRDLETMVERGELRRDLYYRLQAIQIRLPALRERASDIPLLARHLLERVAAERGESARRLDEEAERLLCACPFPGNVRQLDNVLRAASLFAGGDVVTRADLEEHGGLGSARQPAATPAGEAGAGLGWEGAWERITGERVGLRELQKEMERDLLLRALERAGGNITQAAAVLRMKRPRLSQLVKEHGIELATRNGLRPR